MRRAPERRDEAGSATVLVLVLVAVLTTIAVAGVAVGEVCDLSLHPCGRLRRHPHEQIRALRQATLARLERKAAAPLDAIAPDAAQAGICAAAKWIDPTGSLHAAIRAGEADPQETVLRLLPLVGNKNVGLGHVGKTSAKERAARL